MAYFQLWGKKIYYSETGTGAPVVLLHGNAASSNMFYEIAKKYEEVYRTILIDFLGHGQSDRLEEFPTDLWFDEAQQVIAFLKEKHLGKVNLIGTSGGALAAINVALEAPELVNKIIADSFEGEQPLKSFTEHVVEDRENSKRDDNAKLFYQYMHGEDWEQVVDNDTCAITRHDQEIGHFFHKQLNALEPEILLTGSKEDEFIRTVAPHYFETVYGAIVEKIGHGRIHLFETGGHPALLSNQSSFFEISKAFFDGLC